MMLIAIPLYEGFTALDAVGPYEVLTRLPGADVRFAAVEPGPVTTDAGVLSVVAPHALADLGQPDVVVVPGGPAARDLLGHPHPMVDWLAAVHPGTTWTTSVCTGSLILAAAGVLAGKDATTHWGSLDLLGRLGACPTDRRVVFDGKVVTAAGVSAGIDMALALAARIAGDDVARMIQLGIEYDPQPPFDSGSVAKAPPELVDALRRHFAELNAAVPV
jgi:putative intracellular protease/amidase